MGHNAHRSSIHAFFHSCILPFLGSSILEFFGFYVLIFQSLSILERSYGANVHGAHACKDQNSWFLRSSILVTPNGTRVHGCMARKVQRSSVLEFFISRVHRFLLRPIVLWHIHGMQTPDRVHGAQRPVIFGSCVLSFLCSSILAFFSSCVIRFFSSSVVACSSIREHKWRAVPRWRSWGAAPRVWKHVLRGAAPPVWRHELRGAVCVRVSARKWLSALVLAFFDSYVRRFLRRPT